MSRQWQKILEHLNFWTEYKNPYFLDTLLQGPFPQYWHTNLCRIISTEKNEIGGVKKNMKKEN